MAAKSEITATETMQAINTRLREAYLNRSLLSHAGDFTEELIDLWWFPNCNTRLPLVASRVPAQTVLESLQHLSSLSVTSNKEREYKLFMLLHMILYENMQVFELRSVYIAHCDRFMRIRHRLIPYYYMHVYRGLHTIGAMFGHDYFFLKLGRPHPVAHALELATWNGSISEKRYSYFREYDTSLKRKHPVARIYRDALKRGALDTHWRRLFFSQNTKQLRHFKHPVASLFETGMYNHTISTYLCRRFAQGGMSWEWVRARPHPMANLLKGINNMTTPKWCALFATCGPFKLRSTSRHPVSLLFSRAVVRGLLPRNLAARFDQVAIFNHYDPYDADYDDYDHNEVDDEGDDDDDTLQANTANPLVVPGTIIVTPAEGETYDAVSYTMWRDGDEAVILNGDVRHLVRRANLQAILRLGNNPFTRAPIQTIQHAVIRLDGTSVQNS